MSEPKRYDTKMAFTHEHMMYEDNDNGTYVFYSDYSALQAENERLKEMVRLLQNAACPYEEENGTLKAQLHSAEQRLREQDAELKRLREAYYAPDSYMWKQEQRIAVLTEALDGRDEMWAYWLRRQHGHYLSDEVKAVFDRVWLDGLIASARAGVNIVADDAAASNAPRIVGLQKQAILDALSFINWMPSDAGPVRKRAAEVIEKLRAALSHGEQPKVPYTEADVCWCQPFDGPQHPQCPMHGQDAATKERT